MSLDDALRDYATHAEKPPAQALVTCREGTVKTVTAGGATDGNAQVVVTVDGNDLLAPYLASYAPAAGHRVRVLFVGGAPLILGRPIGFPTI